MNLEITIPLWVLALSYWIHLLATVTWLGGLVMMSVVAWPAVRDRIMEADQWVQLQRKFTPWANASLVILWPTGFLQMTADRNYDGFLAFDSLWAQAILIKHIAVIAMMVFALYIQWRIHPALSRIALLEKKRPQMAIAERKKLANQEVRLVRLNLICAAAVLLFTAVATAI
jgi:uncharacterized membrane protein